MNELFEYLLRIEGHRRIFKDYQVVAEHSVLRIKDLKEHRRKVAMSGKRVNDDRHLAQ
jgi:hypothetical protein